jgi:hypothetical protein
MDRIIKTDKGIGPINVDENRDENFLNNPRPWGLTNERIGVKLNGVRNADKIRHNKSDYTPSKGRDKN